MSWPWARRKVCAAWGSGAGRVRFNWGWLGWVRVVWGYVRIGLGQA